MASPTSYKDPYWSDVIDAAESKNDLPKGLLKSIVYNGEKTNNDQVSSAGAKTVFQIIPSTRDAFLKKYGVDAYLNDENAAEVAALHLRESLDRNKNDIESTIGEYHGGGNRANWGKVNAAYRGRVLSGMEKIQADAPETKQLSNDFNSWFASQRTDQPEQAAADQMLAEKSPAIPSKASQVASTQQLSAGGDNGLSTDFGQWLQAQPKDSPLPQQDPGMLAKVGDVVTGNLRQTPETQSLPEWTGMPELNQFSMASAKTGLGTLMASPKEITQIIQANYPGTKVRQDEKGNYLLTSSQDGKEYAIPPGVSVGDIPRILAGIAAFTPAGKTLSMGGGLATRAAASGLASAGTQAGIEATQAATGGDFNLGDVAATGAVGALLPGAAAVAKPVLNTVKQALFKAVGPKTAPAVESAMAAAPEEQAAGGMDRVVISGLPQDAAKVAPMAADELTATTKQAATSFFGKNSATQTLAEQAAPDRKVVDAAKRLGIEDYLQPDHVTTNQVYREMAQAVKSVPGSELRAQELEKLTNVAKNADDLITKLGGTDDLASVSQNVKKGLQDVHDKTKLGASQLYDQIDANLVQKAVEAPAPQTLAFVEARAKTLGGTEYLTPGEKGILKKLSPKREQQPTYALLDQTRKEIGAAKRGAQNAFGNADSKLLGDLESALRADQGNVASANGLGEQWEKAQLLARTYKGFQDDLTSLFGKNLDNSIVGDINSSMAALPKGDTSKLFKLIQSVPEDMRKELVASGLNTAFGKNAKNGSLNFNSYAQWYEGLLRNKQAHTALMTNLPPEARKSLSDLYRVSSSIAKSSKERITTGRLNAVTDQFKGADNLAGRIYEAAKNNAVAGGAALAGSAIHPGIGAVLGSALSKGAKTPAIQAADKLLASPEFQQAVKAAANGNPKQGAKILAFSKPFKRYASQLNQPIPISDRERWVLQALEANQQQSKSR